MPRNRIVTLAILTALLSAGCRQRTFHQDTDTDIVGGSRAAVQPDVARHVVSLMAPSGSSYCTGSLVAPGVVLTAAHCVQTPFLQWNYVYFGEVQPRDELGGGHHPNARRITHMVYHKDYNLEQMGDIAGKATAPVNDIAVVYFEGSVPPGYAPIRLRTPEEPLNRLDPLILIGFGLANDNSRDTSNLQQTKSKVGELNAVALEIIDSYAADPGNTGRPTGTCQGDSGGPLMVRERDNTLSQVALVSRGPECAAGFGINTDIRQHRAWIDQAIAARSRITGQGAGAYVNSEDAILPKEDGPFLVFDLAGMVPSSNSFYFACTQTEPLGKRARQVYADDRSSVVALFKKFGVEDKPENCTALYQKVREAKTLDLSGMDVKSAWPLEDFLNLEELNLANNQIQVVSPLSNLIFLRRLDLSNNRISRFAEHGVQALGTLKRAESLNLSGNPLNNRRCPVAHLGAQNCRT